MGGSAQATQHLEYSGVISERKFAASHLGFWDHLLPFSESFVRRCNLRAIQAGNGVPSVSATETRAFLGELSLRVFSHHYRQSLPPDGVATPSAELVSRTLDDFRRFEGTAHKVIN